MKPLLCLLLMLPFEINAQGILATPGPNRPVPGVPIGAILPGPDLPVNEEGRISFSGTLELPGKTKSHIAERFKEWVIVNLKSNKGMYNFIFQDKATTNSFIQLGGIQDKVGKQNLWFTTKATFKDGEFTYEFTNMYMGPVNADMPAEEFLQDTEARSMGEKDRQVKATWTAWRDETRKAMESLQKSLEAHMKK